MNPGFFGRTEQLKTALKLVQAPDPLATVVYVFGAGGIGKTTFLRKFHEQLSEAGQNIRLTPIIDLAEPTRRSLGPLLAEIGDSLDAKAFTTFHMELDRFERRREQGAPSGRGDVAYEAVIDTFVTSFNKLSAETRAVVFLDSAEYVKSDDLWSDFFAVFGKLNNVCLFLAGRPDGINAARDMAWSHDQGAPKEYDIQLLELDLDDATKFLQQSIPSLDDEMQWKLHFLSFGKPILLALISYRLLRGLALPELARQTQASLTKQVPTELRSQFEASLVDFLLAPKNPVDEALVVMAHLDQRFDAEIAALALGTPASEIPLLLQDLKNVPYVKLVGDDYLVLHEEVTRLVRRHVWERIDPYREQRQELTDEALAYYEGKIAELRAERDRLQRELNEASTGQSIDPYLNRSRQQNEERLSKYEHERIAYECNDVNPARLKDAISHFIEAFDGQRDFHYREDLLKMLEDQIRARRLSSEDQFEVSIRRARWLRAKGSLDAAVEELATWESRTLSPTQIFQLRSLRGEIARQRGHVGEALQHQDEAKDAAPTSDPTKKAMALQNKARTLYAMGFLKNAVDLYTEAITDMPSATPAEAVRRADVMSNLAFVLGLMGDWVNGIAWAEAALRIKKQYAGAESVAQTLINLGSNYWTKGDYHTARHLYETAMQVLGDSEENLQVRARVFFSLGIADWFAKELDLAEDHFRQAIALFDRSGHRREMPLAIHNLGHIIFEQGDLAEAERIYLEGEQLSRQYHDHFALADSLVGLAELRTRQGRVEELAELENEFNTLRKEGYHFPLFEGRMQRILGEVALSRDDLTDAGVRFTRGIAWVAQHGGYGKYSLGNELSKLGQIMDDLAPDTVLQWCTLLEAEATAAELTDRRQEIDAFVKVRRAILGRRE